MARISEEPEIEIEEYEEIVGNWDQASVREGAADIRAVSIQDPTSDEQFNSMTHTERPALRPIERSFLSAIECNPDQSKASKKYHVRCKRTSYVQPYDRLPERP